MKHNLRRYYYVILVTSEIDGILFGKVDSVDV